MSIPTSADQFTLWIAEEKGYGKTLLTYLARLALERDCGRPAQYNLQGPESELGFRLVLEFCSMITFQWMVEP